MIGLEPTNPLYFGDSIWTAAPLTNLATPIIKCSSFRAVINKRYCNALRQDQHQSLLVARNRTRLSLLLNTPYGTRTHTTSILSAMTLPIGLREHIRCGCVRTTPDLKGAVKMTNKMRRKMRLMGLEPMTYRLKGDYSTD